MRHKNGLTSDGVDMKSYRARTTLRYRNEVDRNRFGTHSDDSFIFPNEDPDHSTDEKYQAISLDTGIISYGKNASESYTNLMLMLAIGIRRLVDTKNDLLLLGEYNDPALVHESKKHPRFGATHQKKLLRQTKKLFWAALDDRNSKPDASTTKKTDILEALSSSSLMDDTMEFEVVLPLEDDSTSNIK